jgi:hypothetical protein
MSRPAKNKSSKPSTAVMTAHEQAQAESQSQSIADSIRSDMQVAENGMFYALRAGVGMLRIKDMYAHGNWAGALLNLLPEKAPRTLRTYMQIGQNFCDAKQISTQDAWVGMRTIRTDRLLAAPDQQDEEATAADDAAEANPLEQDVREFVQEFGSIRKAVKKEINDGMPLTKEERQDAARAIWHKIANMAQDELNHDSSGLLSDDDLDGLASVLRTVSDTLRKQLSQRSKI